MSDTTPETPATGGGKTTSVPGIGKVKTSYVWIGGGIALGIIGYAWWRNRQNAATAAATPTVVPPVGSYVNPDPSVTSGAQSTDTTGSSITTNPEWTQHALDMLGTYTSVDTSAAAVAIGNWFAGQGLTSDQKAILWEAIGLAGDPPDLSQWGGQLPPMKDALPSTNTNPGDTGGTTTTVAPAVPTGLHQVSATRTSLSFAWDPVPGAIDYQYWESSDFGGSVPRNTTTTNATWNGLTPGVEHVFYVKARNSAGDSNPAFIHAWTQK